MIPVMDKCDACARMRNGLIDGWLPACEAFPDGIPGDFMLSNDARVVCGNEVGFKEKEQAEERKRTIAW